MAHERIDLLEDELLSLRAAYAASLPARLITIEDCWQRLKGSTANSEIATELGTELHQLAGSAGSFGMAELGEAAARAERLLNDADNFDDRGFRQDFDTACSEIEALIRSA